MALQSFCWTSAVFSVNRTPWTGDQPVARPLPTRRTTQTQNKFTQTSTPWLGFEPMIPAFKRARTVHGLDCVATVIGGQGSHIFLLMIIRGNPFPFHPWQSGIYCSWKIRIHTLKSGSCHLAATLWLGRRDRYICLARTSEPAAQKCWLF
jgi:hypothetical protein